MSFLKDKLGRSAVVVAFSLGAFQALSLVGATSATAAPAPGTTCSVAGGVITISIPADGDQVAVWVDTNGGIHASSANGAAPVVSTANDIAGCTGVQAGVATTTAINITGGSGATTNTDQTAIIEMATYVSAAPATLPATQATAKWGAINWTVNLGNQNVADTFTVNDANTAAVAELDVTGGVNGIDLDSNADLDVVLANIEVNHFTNAAGSLADNTIDLSGSTATGAAFAADSFIDDAAAALTDQTLFGGDGDDVINGVAASSGDDWIAPGLGNDNITCGAGEDTLDYSNTATAVVLNLAINTVTQGTDLDTLTGAAGASGCEDAIGTAAGDTITGDAANNWLTPGAGDDKVTGGAGEDTYDVSDAEEGVTVDLGAGTSTGGSGTDTLSQIEDVNGSDSPDVITGDGNDNELFGNSGNDTLSGGAGDGDGDDFFDGGSGTDTIDFSANTLSTDVDLDSFACQGADGDCDEIEPNTIENARLGSGDDFFSGSAFNNIAFPGGGQNAIQGEGGIDTVNYSYGYTAGVTINMTGGGAAGGSQDAITGFENAVGTAFNDHMFGTDVVEGTNGANLLVGGKGNDNISANAGPDLVKGGAGNDRVRGGAGDDTVLGQGGNDNIRGSGGADDINGGKGKDYCNGGGGNDFIKHCEKPKHNGHGPNGHSLHQRI